MSQKYDEWYGMDTENDEKGRVTLVALIHESGAKKIWHGVGHFQRWCEKQKGNPVVICHNLEYDLVNEFGSNYPYLQLNYLKGRLISAKYGRVKFLDSFNHFRMSLKDLGKAIGIRKLDFDIHSEEYVTTDAWICLKAMTMARDFIASMGGEIGATSGSSSVSVWRAMTNGAYELGPIDNEWLRSGYYGGRTEIFASYASGDIRGYDVNSMYPYVMLGDFPENLYGDRHLDRDHGMAEVTIQIPVDMPVAPLVYRASDGRLIYPVGVFRGTWTHEEIRYAESLGATIIKVHQAVGGSVCLRPFDDFINTCYKRRLETTDSAFRLFYKVVMNSLYGKIASRNIVTRTVSRHSLVKKGSKRLDDVTWINYHRGLLDYKTPPQPYVNLVWGAMITARARLLITRYLMEVPPEKLIYCDTDSVYCVDHELSTGTALGEMKLERRNKVMRVKQKKTYNLDNYYRAKGVPRPKFNDNGEMVFDFAKQYFEEGYTEFQQPVRFKESIRSKRGKANQWITKSRSLKTTDIGKRPLGYRYLPPIAKMQLDMFDEDKSKVVTK